jgi:hypothetical protein
MADIQTNAPSSTAVVSRKPRQGRSPAFPFIPLNKAIERAETFRVAEGGRPKHFSPLVSACKAWGIGVKTGPGIQTVAALGHYGLFEFQGSGEARYARLTDLAFRILLDKQPVSPERDELIRQAALTPRIHAELWKNWPNGLPSNATLETYLVRDRGFSESGARDLIAQFKETIAFAKLGEPAIIPQEQPGSSTEQKGKQEIEIGDLVQIEIDGVLSLEKRAHVRAVQEYDGIPWVFIDGSETGIPMEQVVLEQKGKEDLKPAINAPRLPLENKPAAQRGTRQEIFALDEGDVVLSYPDNMSPASFYDLEGYLTLFLRKAQRRAGAGDFFAEVYAPDGVKAKEVRYFDDFPSLVQFIEAFRGKASADILRVHLPARATDEQRHAVSAMGAQSA